MKVRCSRCGKRVDKEHTNILNGEIVCADDRNCYKQVHYVNHKARILNLLKSRYAI